MRDELPSLVSSSQPQNYHQRTDSDFSTDSYLVLLSTRSTFTLLTDRNLLFGRLPSLEVAHTTSISSTRSSRPPPPRRPSVKLVARGLKGTSLLHMVLKMRKKLKSGGDDGCGLYHQKRSFHCCGGRQFAGTLTREPLGGAGHEIDGDDFNLS
jgi:hypothetical protein